jgi:hypothetical protein
VSGQERVGWCRVSYVMTHTKEDLLKQVDSLRDLSRRARRLSQNLGQEVDQQRLLTWAVELDANAARIEAEAASAKTMVIAPVRPLVRP